MGQCQLSGGNPTVSCSTNTALLPRQPGWGGSACNTASGDRTWISSQLQVTEQKDWVKRKASCFPSEEGAPVACEDALLWFNSSETEGQRAQASPDTSQRPIRELTGPRREAAASTCEKPMTSWWRVYCKVQFESQMWVKLLARFNAQHPPRHPGCGWPPPHRCTGRSVGHSLSHDCLTSCCRAETGSFSPWRYVCDTTDLVLTTLLLRKPQKCQVSFAHLWRSQRWTHRVRAAAPWTFILWAGSRN